MIYTRSEIYGACRCIPDFHRFGTDELTTIKKVLMDLPLRIEPRAQLLHLFLTYTYNNISMLIDKNNNIIYINDVKTI